MRILTPLFLLLIFIGYSCSKTSEESHDQSETLRLSNETIRKIVDLKLNEAIWTDDQRGRKNEEWISKLKQLGGSRKDLNFEDLYAVEAHVSTLKALQRESPDPTMQRLFVRMDEYLAKCQSDPKNLPLLRAEVSNIEFALVEHWSRQMGLVDCCFPSPIKVQTNGEGAADLPFEMAIFPGGDRALWEHATYVYEDIYLERSGNKIPVEIESRKIGHVIVLQFTLENAGEYVVHFSVTETGDYLAGPWRQDFEWPVVIQ